MSQSISSESQWTPDRDKAVPRSENNAKASGRRSISASTLTCLSTTLPAQTSHISNILLQQPCWRSPSDLSPPPITLISPPRNNPSHIKAAPLTAQPAATKGHFSGTCALGAVGAARRGASRGKWASQLPIVRQQGPIPSDGGRRSVTARTGTSVTRADMAQTSEGRETAEGKDAVTGDI